jgi:hypothetical protein
MRTASRGLFLRPNHGTLGGAAIAIGCASAATISAPAFDRVPACEGRRVGGGFRDGLGFPAPRCLRLPRLCLSLHSGSRLCRRIAQNLLIVCHAKMYLLARRGPSQWEKKLWFRAVHWGAKTILRGFLTLDNPLIKEKNPKS